MTAWLHAGGLIMAVALAIACGRDAANKADAPRAPLLAGTKWRLETLAGKRVVDRARATLEFTGDGHASGHGSCNRFRGPVTLTGDSIAFGPLVATRMFCGDTVTNQETEYLAALDQAVRYEVRDSFLYIHAAGRAEPLRFVTEPAQDEGFRAIGQEPGWELRIREGGEIRFIYDYGNDTVTTPVPPRQRSPESGGLLYNVKTESSHLQVVIDPSPCTDAMSGQPFETTVTVILNGNAFRGCGGPMPSNATPSPPRAAPRAD